MVRYFKTFTIVFICLLFITMSGCKGEVQTGILPEGYEANVSGHITVTYPLASMDQDKLSLSYFSKEFMKKYDKASVTLDFSAGDTNARIAAGDIGDVFFIWEENVYTYGVENLALMPLDAYIEPLNIDKDNVYSGIYDLGVAKGLLFMAARDHTHIVLFYNATALEEEGLPTPPDDWDWELFLDYCRKLTKTEPDGTYTQVGATWNGAYGPHLIPFLEGWGGQWYDEVNKKINLVSDELVLKGFEAQIKAMEEGILQPYKASGTRASNYSRLAFEDYIFRDGVFPTLTTAGKQYDAKGVDWNIANWPQFPVHRVGTGATGFGVYNRTKSPDTAAAFALFLFTDEGQRAYNGQVGGSVPLTKNLAQEDFWKVPYDKEKLNYDAFVSFPGADTVGKFQNRVPNSVANIIIQRMDSVFERHWSGTQDYYDSLKEIERLATEKWQKLFEETNQNQG